MDIRGRSEYGQPQIDGVGFSVAREVEGLMHMMSILLTAERWALTTYLIMSK